MVNIRIFPDDLPPRQQDQALLRPGPPAAAAQPVQPHTAREPNRKLPKLQVTRLVISMFRKSESMSFECQVVHHLHVPRAQVP